jgi:hypothetical protein
VITKENFRDHQRRTLKAVEDSKYKYRYWNGTFDNERFEESLGLYNMIKYAECKDGKYIVKNLGKMFSERNKYNSIPFFKWMLLR